MPISEYYGGKGEQVMRKMKDEYGEKTGERVFYATENKRKARRRRKRVVRKDANFDKLRQIAEKG